jgi:hypothetical protein
MLVLVPDLINAQLSVSNDRLPLGHVALKEYLVGHIEQPGYSQSRPQHRRD